MNGFNKPISIKYKMVHGFNQTVLGVLISKCSLSRICPVFSCVSEQVSNLTLSEKKLDYFGNCKPEISDICNVVEVHCLQVLKIMQHYANSCFDWLISGHQSVNHSREAISILSGKYKGFTFVHSVVISLTLVRIFYKIHKGKAITKF